jgi:hypothetical protein
VSAVAAERSADPDEQRAVGRGGAPREMLARRRAENASPRFPVRVAFVVARSSSVVFQTTARTARERGVHLGVARGAPRARRR